MEEDEKSMWFSELGLERKGVFIGRGSKEPSRDKPRLGGKHRFCLGSNDRTGGKGTARSLSRARAS